MLLHLPTVPLLERGKPNGGLRCLVLARHDNQTDTTGLTLAASASGGGQSERADHSKRGARRYDAGKKIKGRKRHIVVDSRGSLLGVLVTPADGSDAQGAYEVLDEVLSQVPSV